MSAVEQVKQAILFLDGSCDGAKSYDTIGFNATDSTFGKSLARQLLSGSTLSPKQLIVAHKMLKKYARTQLASGGKVLPTEDDLKKELGVSLAVAEKSNDRKVDIVKDAVEVRFNYNPEVLQAVKSIQPKGRYQDNSKGKYWVFRTDDLKQIVDKLLPYGFVFSQSVLDFIQVEQESERLDKEEIDQCLQWSTDYLKQLIDTWNWKPFAHQLEAVQFFLTRRNKKCIIADEQGLGKTLSSLMAVKSYKAWLEEHEGYDSIPVFVVCPVSLKLNWVKEAGMVNMAIEAFSYQKMTPPASTPYIVIFDESHAFQNIKSTRTEKMLDLASNDNCLGLIHLTGTPMKNGRPSNLFPLLKACNHRLSVSRSDYEKKYCGAYLNAFGGWDNTGATNLEELRKNITDVLIRRTKEQCLDLPKKLYTGVTCESNPEAEREYKDSLETLKEEYQERVEAGEVSSTAQAMVFLGYLRRLSSVYKSYHTINMVQDLLEQGQPVVVFTEFKESAHRIAEAFGVPPLTGETKMEDRQRMVDDFQSGETSVFVGTIKAGGVGITLTNASYLIMNDYPWTPGDYHQATDRIHRIGQTKVCNIYNVYGKDIDYLMASLIGKKTANIDKVLHKIKIKESDFEKPEFYQKLVKQLMATAK